MQFRIKELLLLIVVFSLSFAIYVQIAIRQKAYHERYKLSQMPEQIRVVSISLASFYVASNSIKWTSFDQAVLDAVMLDSEFADYVRRHDHIQRGEDLWGSKLILDFSLDGKVLIIRSIGPNKVDEGGMGDDIEIKTRVSE